MGKQITQNETYNWSSALSYRSSSLEVSPLGRTVFLRFVPPAYELTLRDDGERLCERATLTGAQLRQVTLDMRPVQDGPVKLTYAARHVLFEINGKLFARVLDIDVMRLHDAASAGLGEIVSVDRPFGLR